MHPFYLRVLVFLFCVVSLVYGIKFSQDGFANIESFKKLERLVPSKLIGLLEGENQVRGNVSKTSEQNYVRSPKTNTPSLYYRYLLEKEERDSDGNSRWVTLKNESRSVDFIVEDSTSKAMVLTNNLTDNIRWFLPKRYSKVSGGYRYSEWRVEPEDSVSMFAWAEIEHKQDGVPELNLRFDKKGQYIPVITTMTAGEVRADIGNTAIIKIWGGVSLIALGLMFFVYTAQVHRILAFLSLLTVFCMGTLGVYGMASLSSDVRGGSDYFLSQQDKAEIVVRKLLETQSIDWTGWQLTNKVKSQEYSRLLPWQQNRIGEIRRNLGVLQAIYLQQISHFPENMYAWFTGIDKPTLRIDLTEHELSIVERNINSFVQTKLNVFAYWWVLAGGFAFCLFTYFGFRYAKVKRMIENIPTSATAGVSFGLAEVKGKVKFLNDDYLKGPVTQLNCVWYRYLVEEHRGSGKNARWVTISDEEKFKRFNCEDKEGTLAIDPDGAEIITRHKKVKRKGEMRYSEWLLRPSDNLYALGMAKVDVQKSDQLVLGKPQHETDNSDLFILTNYSEQELMIKKASIAIFALSLAFSGMFAAAVFYFGMNGQFAATDYLLSAMLAPTFLFFFMLVLHYNDMIFLQKRAERNWANIQVSLKKRADLLPQLQGVLSQYQNYEKNLLEQITVQRKQLRKSIETVGDASHFIQAEHQFLNDLKLAVEAYPDLKANELSSRLMVSLTKLENEVALMRTGFNDAVNEYNTRVEVFPDVLLAKIFKFRKMEWLRNS
jgi:hypothetical protein